MVGKHACSAQSRGRAPSRSVQFVNGAQRDLHENRLALCPTCAAKYKHARGTSFADLRDDLLTQEVATQGSLTVDVVLADEPATVRFVGKHAIDLQAVLEATEGSPVQDDDYAYSEVDGDSEP